jgi:hypothetical protein
VRRKKPGRYGRDDNPEQFKKTEDPSLRFGAGPFEAQDELKPGLYK